MADRKIFAKEMLMTGFTGTQKKSGKISSAKACGLIFHTLQHEVRIKQQRIRTYEQVELTN